LWTYRGLSYRIKGIMADISNIRGSDGTGSAAKASVTQSRAVNNPTITVDGLSHWPAKFIAVTGTPDLVAKTIVTSTLQVFFGHSSGSTIIIDSFAPGYTDKGNAIGDIVILKPTTAGQDEIADLFARAHKNDGSIKQVDGNAAGLVFSAAATQPAPDPDGRITVWFEPL
jgi:hypothetical protein